MITTLEFGDGHIVGNVSFNSSPDGEGFEALEYHSYSCPGSMQLKLVFKGPLRPDDIYEDDDTVLSVTQEELILIMCEDIGFDRKVEFAICLNYYSSENVTLNFGNSDAMQEISLQEYAALPDWATDCKRPQCKASGQASHNYSEVGVFTVTASLAKCDFSVIEKKIITIGTEKDFERDFGELQLLSSAKDGVATIEENITFVGILLDSHENIAFHFDFGDGETLKNLNFTKIPLHNETQINNSDKTIQTVITHNYFREGNITVALTAQHKLNASWKIVKQINLHIQEKTKLIPFLYISSNATQKVNPYEHLRFTITIRDSAKPEDIRVDYGDGKIKHIRTLAEYTCENKNMTFENTTPSVYCITLHHQYISPAGELTVTATVVHVSSAERDALVNSTKINVKSLEEALGMVGVVLAPTASGVSLASDNLSFVIYADNLLPNTQVTIMFGDEQAARSFNASEMSPYACPFTNRTCYAMSVEHAFLVSGDYNVSVTMTNPMAQADTPQVVTGGTSIKVISFEEAVGNVFLESNATDTDQYDGVAITAGVEHVIPNSVFELDFGDGRAART